ncbi:MAG: metallophosphoesterase, partial [Clostridia bacterium]|nr:metallophosphoesterase [Clostridia bacterium]
EVTAMFDRKPCVYLVGREYQIVFNTVEPGIGWVEVDGEVYPDEKNGLMRSGTLHRAAVPCDRLDAAKRYAVCFRALPERKPYWPELGALERQEYAFRPIDWRDGLQIYHLADAHSHAAEAVETGRYFGEKLDLLVMNGDIPAESKTERDVLAVFDIAGGVTGGERPVVFARGNHDTRGKFALEFTDFIGTDRGDTYFTFRSGGLWGIVLDCGEDKRDSSDEYGGIVCCEPFRRRQTAFLRRVVERKAEEFGAEGVSLRLAVCHVPFMTELMAAAGDKFDIERERYAEWTALLNEMGIDLMLCGHQHSLHAFKPGDPALRYGANFPVLVGSMPMFFKKDDQRSDRFVGAALEAKDGEIAATYTDNKGWREPAFTVPFGAAKQ